MLYKMGDPTHVTHQFPLLGFIGGKMLRSHGAGGLIQGFMAFGLDAWIALIITIVALVIMLHRFMPSKCRARLTPPDMALNLCRRVLGAPDSSLDPTLTCKSSPLRLLSLGLVFLLWILTEYFLAFFLSYLIAEPYDYVCDFRDIAQRPELECWSARQYMTKIALNTLWKRSGQEHYGQIAERLIEGDYHIENLTPAYQAASRGKRIIIAPWVYLQNHLQHYDFLDLVKRR